MGLEKNQEKMGLCVLEMLNNSGNSIMLFSSKV